MRTPRWSFAVLLSAVAATALPAQDAPWTLQSWSDALWLRTLDRDGSIGGRVGEPGVLRRYQPSIGRNYPSDLLHARGGANEDATWQAGGNGLRYRTGSVDRRDLWWDATLRHEGSQGPWTGGVRVDVEQGPEARRTLPQVRAGRHLSPRLHAELLATVPRHKPDLDLGVALTLRPAPRSTLRAELVALDPWTNYHYAARREAIAAPGLLGVADTALRLRGAQPLALRLAAQLAPHRSLTIDLQAARTTRTQLAVTTALTAPDGGRSFTTSDDGGFAGLLVGWQAHPQLRLGALATTLRFDAAREYTRGALAATDAGTLRESQTALGLLAALRIDQRWTADAVVLREQRPERRRDATGTLVLDHVDRAWSGRAAITRRGSGRSAISAVTSVDLRTVEARVGAVPARTPLAVRRLRLALEPSWQLGRATTLVTALRYDADVDGLRPRWRDLAGFHARIVTFW